MTKTMVIFAILLLLFFLFLSCNDRKVNQPNLDIGLKTEDICMSCLNEKDKIRLDSLKYVVPLTGDTIGYNELVILARQDEKRQQDRLGYAMFMANTYNYPKAYYDVYIALAGSANKEILPLLDDKIKNLALFYLVKSYELGSAYDASYVVKDFFGDSIPPSYTFLERWAKEEKELYKKSKLK